MTTQTGYSICSICDIGCQVRTESERWSCEAAIENDLVGKNICFKGVAAPDLNCPDRLRVPLKRVGERGEDGGMEISYEQAMDEIAERLKKVVDEYGPGVTGAYVGMEYPNDASRTGALWICWVRQTGSSVSLASPQRRLVSASPTAGSPSRLSKYELYHLFGHNARSTLGRRSTT